MKYELNEVLEWWRKNDEGGMRNEEWGIIKKEGVRRTCEEWKILRMKDEGCRRKDEEWRMKDEGWIMKDAGERVKNEGWRIKDEEWKIKDEGWIEWRMKNEEWKMKDEVNVMYSCNWFISL